MIAETMRSVNIKLKLLKRIVITSKVIKHGSTIARIREGGGGGGDRNLPFMAFLALFKSILTDRVRLFSPFFFTIQATIGILDDRIAAALNNHLLMSSLIPVIITSPSMSQKKLEIMMTTLSCFLLYIKNGVCQFVECVQRENNEGTCLCPLKGLAVVAIAQSSPLTHKRVDKMRLYLIRSLLASSHLHFLYSLLNLRIYGSLSV